MNNHIKQKLDSLTNLPDGYTPNLDSKWDTLHAALHNNQQPDKSLMIWKRIAAVLLLASVGFGYLYWDKKNETMIIEGKANNTLLIYKPAKQSPQLPTLPVNQVPIIKTKQNIETIAIAEQQLPTPTETIEANEAVANAAPKRAKRFVEIDFGDADDTPVMHAQATNQPDKHISFKLKRSKQTVDVATEETPKTLLSFSNSF
jgi:hypothetical protein